MMFVADVENLSASFVVSRVFGLTKLTSSSVEFPVNPLNTDEEKTNESKERDRYQSLKYQYPPDRHLEIYLNLRYVIGHSS